MLYLCDKKNINNYTMHETQTLLLFCLRLFNVIAQSLQCANTTLQVYKTQSPDSKQRAASCERHQIRI